MSANPEGCASLNEAAEAVAAYLPHRPRPSDHQRLEKNLRKRPDGRYYWHWDPRMLRVWQSSAHNTHRNTQRLLAAAQALPVPTLIVRGGYERCSERTHRDRVSGCRSPRQKCRCIGCRTYGSREF